jgi:hypothetical protein
MKLAIRNWEKFQHYHNRRPPWVKLYTNILDEYDDAGNLKKFRRLPDTAKLTFLMLLPLASEYGGIVPNDDPRWLSERLGLKKVEIEPLITSCYVERCGNASSDASNSASEMLSLEREKEREKETEREARFESCWQAFGKYGVRKRARMYWGAYRNDEDLAAIETAIPKYLACVNAGRAKKQFEGWLNPEHRLWSMDWGACLIELNRKNALSSGRPNPHILNANQRANMTRDEIDAHNAKHGIIEDRR